VEPRWAQVIDAEIIRKVTEWLLPGLACPCCGAVTFADPPPRAHQGAVSYGPALNAAAVLLSCYGNVPPERAARVMGMLLGIPVSAGWVDKAAARVSAQLGKAGFDDAMLAALAGEDVLAADETPVNVLDGTAPPAPAPEEGENEKDPEGKDAARKRRNGIRLSPATGIPWQRSPAGAACAATLTRPLPTASPHLTPSPAPSPASPGYRHSPPSTDPNSRHPVNGHRPTRGCARRSA
jgi:hypothetical protein